MQVALNTPDQFFDFLRSSGLRKKYGLENLALFGSFARREPFQDIDILVEENADWKVLEDFRNEFTLLTGIKLDIMMRQFADPLVLKYALQDICYDTKA